MGTAKVVFNKRVLTDVTYDTVSETALMGGVTALGSDGDVVEGAARENKENEIVEGSLSGTYVNNDIVQIGLDALAYVDTNQSSTLQVSCAEVLSVDQEAFYSCSHLTSINLPKATTIGSSAFQSCTALTNVSFPKATTFYSDVFRGCTSLESITLPEATTLAYRTFSGCTNLTTVNLPKISEIYTDSFANCNKLSSVNIPYACGFWGGVFINCSSLSQWVNDSAFCDNSNFVGCRTLLVADMSVNLGQIWAWTFSGCQQLSTLIFRKNSLSPLANINAFTNSPFSSGGTGGTLYVPSAQIASYQSATNWATILGYTNNQVLAIEGSPYESFFADGTPIEEPSEGPRYNINGTYYQNSGGNTTLTIKDGHWHVYHISSGGNGGISLKQFFCGTFRSVSHTFLIKISNFNLISGTIPSGNSPGQNIAFGTGGSSQVQLWLWSDGNGDYETTFTYTVYSNPTLTYNLPWCPAYEIEFDFKLFIDGAWYC